MDGLFLNGCVLFWWVGEYCLRMGVFCWVGGGIVSERVCFGGWVGGCVVSEWVCFGGWVGILFLNGCVLDGWVGVLFLNGCVLFLFSLVGGMGGMWF